MDNIAFYKPQTAAKATKEVVTVPMMLLLARNTSYLSEIHPVDEDTLNWHGMAALTGTQWKKGPPVEPYITQGQKSFSNTFCTPPTSTPTSYTNTFTPSSKWTGTPSLSSTWTNTGSWSTSWTQPTGTSSWSRWGGGQGGPPGGNGGGHWRQ